jgi:hypothetical protein
MVFHQCFDVQRIVVAGHTVISQHGLEGVLTPGLYLKSLSASEVQFEKRLDDDSIVSCRGGFGA